MQTAWLTDALGSWEDTGPSESQLPWLPKAETTGCLAMGTDSADLSRSLPALGFYSYPQPDDTGSAVKSEIPDI